MVWLDRLVDIDTLSQEIFAGPNLHENHVSSPEEIFAVLIFTFRELLTMPLYRRQANRGQKMCRKG